MTCPTGEADEVEIIGHTRQMKMKENYPIKINL
jgi:hypothetical protein